MRIALDTNILAYAEGVNSAARQDYALSIADQVRAQGNVLFVPAQVLGELFNVLVLKVRMPSTDARRLVLEWRNNVTVIDTTSAVLAAAFDLAVVHGLRIWDAVILSAAAAANCRLLLSEDMHHGFTWNGVTVVNPFSPDRHPLLAEALNTEHD